jgi:uncharacterized membrane protein
MARFVTKMGSGRRTSVTNIGFNRTQHFEVNRHAGSAKRAGPLADNRRNETMWNSANLALVGSGDGTWYGDHWAWPWFMGMHGLLGTVFMVAVIVALVMLIRSAIRPGPAADTGGSAMGILDARYAGGDIDHDEYRLRKKELS